MGQPGRSLVVFGDGEGRSNADPFTRQDLHVQAGRVGGTAGEAMVIVTWQQLTRWRGIGVSLRWLSPGRDPVGGQRSRHDPTLQAWCGPLGPVWKA
jgi:hypothetical protein